MNNYDEWKLSNPFDDGHYTEDETTPIPETAMFKYRNHTTWSYCMITTEGYDIRVHRYVGSPSIELNQIDPTSEELEDTIERIQLHYKDLTYIEPDEFERHYKEARQMMDIIVRNETGS